MLPSLRHAFDTSVSGVPVVPRWRFAGRRGQRGVSAKARAWWAGPPAMAASGGAYDWKEAIAAQGPAQVFPAAERNKEPILRALEKHLPVRSGLSLLEVASGTGQHAAHIARNLPTLTVQPTDVATDHFPSIAALARGVGGVLPPRVLDASWPAERWAEALGAGGPTFDAVLAANLTHISPWEATAGLVAGAAALLRPGGLLVVYGPFKIDGQFTTASNRAFHDSLVASNPAWGYRDTRDIEALGRLHGLALEAVDEMPANNLFLVLRAPVGGA